MKKNFLTLAAITVLAASTVLAQGRGNGNGNQPGGAGPGSSQGTGTPQVDVSQTVTVEGKVLSFTASQGSGMPTLAVRDGSKDYTFVLGPYRYLTAQQFAAQAGDTVKVTFYVCTSCENGMAVAQVVNVTRNLTLKLRSADGVPLWRGPNGYRGHGKGQGQGQGNGPNGSCQGAGPDMARVAVVEGTVKSFEGGPGQGQPELVLATAAGDKTYRLSPYRVLASSGFLPAEGARLKLTVVPVLVDGVEEWVVVTLEDASSGFKLDLRDPQTGIPVGGRGRGRC